MIDIRHGDALDILSTLPDASVDAVVCDPPYGLEFMGKNWDAPWQEPGINADAGFSQTGLSDGWQRLPRPSFTGSTNPRCLNCGGNARGRRDGTALRKVCTCAAPDFPNVRAVEMRAFQQWCEQWAAECLRVLKPGGYLLAFGGTRTVHRLTCGIEDAGFEIRDGIDWLYGSGFPKSLDVSKAIDKAAGAEREVVGVHRRHGGGSAVSGSMAGPLGTASELPLTAPATPDARQWQGWGGALKPAREPIVMARKPLAGTVAANVQQHGTGAINIDACRTPTGDNLNGGAYSPGTRSADLPGAARGSSAAGMFANDGGRIPGGYVQPPGRWPTNVIMSHAGGDDTGDACADECVDGCPVAALDAQSGIRKAGERPANRQGIGDGYGLRPPRSGTSGKRQQLDSGGASRFFPVFRYQSKAPTRERPKVDGVAHPTVKPLDLMRWLVRLVTPVGGHVLDPFAGSGTTVEACLLEGFAVTAIEREADYLPLIQARIDRNTPQT